MKLRILSAALVAAMSLSTAAMAGSMSMSNPMVGGAAMYADRDIVDNAVNSKDHTTLVAAVKAAGLVDTLSGAGPFTVFAPTNEAFAALPKGTVDTLLEPQNKGKLTTVLTYHVVPGRLDSIALKEKIAAGGGKAELKTVEGGTATITIADVFQSNGVIHVVSAVAMPK